MPHGYPTVCYTARIIKPKEIFDGIGKSNELINKKPCLAIELKI